MKMLFVIIPIIMLLVALFLVGKIYGFSKIFSLLGIKNAKNSSNLEQKQSKKLKIASIIISVVAVLILIFVPQSIHQVNAGEIAVVKVWGDAREIRRPGIHFDFWISHEYDIYDAKVQQTIVKTSTYSSDGQTMEIELVIQYQIQQENALLIAQKYGGLDMLQNRIETISIEKMKSVLSQKSAMVIIETRSTVSPDVEESIRNAITSDFYVDITTVVLTDISFTDAFEKTVEDKMIAEQEKLKAEYEKEKAIIEAEQQLEVAKLNAEANIAKAKGEAQAIEEVAKAQSNAIKLKSIEVARMLGFNINETVDGDVTIYEIDFTDKTEDEIKLIKDYMEYISYLEVWDGKLPSVVTGDSATVMIPTI